MKEILTRKETAAYLRISPSTLDRWVKKGIIPAFNAAGGRVLFNKGLVDKAVRGNETAV